MGEIMRYIVLAMLVLICTCATASADPVAGSTLCFRGTDGVPRNCFTVPDLPHISLAGVGKTFEYSDGTIIQDQWVGATADPVDPTQGSWGTWKRENLAWVWSSTTETAMRLSGEPKDLSNLGIDGRVYLCKTKLHGKHYGIYDIVRSNCREAIAAIDAHGKQWRCKANGCSRRDKKKPTRFSFHIIEKGDVASDIKAGDVARFCGGYQFQGNYDVWAHDCATAREEIPTLLMAGKFGTMPANCGFARNVLSCSSGSGCIYAHGASFQDNFPTDIEIYGVTYMSMPRTNCARMEFK